MRLWHIDLIPYLPKSQLLAQWRELNSIFKKQDKHILINYIYNYPKAYLKNYSMKVMHEMWARGYKTKDGLYDKYFNHDMSVFATNIPMEKRFVIASDTQVFTEHNNDYLTICYYNLKEKYIRGQKDFTKDVWEKLDKFYKERINNGF